MAKSKHFEEPRLIAAGNFIREGSYFYIPAYQRPLSWGADNIYRLFEGIVDDIRRRMIPGEEKSPDAHTVSFIGSILCYKGGSDAIHPQVENHVPQDVLSVIDGQQRLTVLIMSFIVLHDYIRVARSGLLKKSEGLLQEKCIEIMDELSHTFQITWKYGDERVYPKMIRAFEDQWSRNKKGLGKKSPKYSSPLSNYSYLYGKFLYDNAKQGLEDTNNEFDYDDKAEAEDKANKEAYHNFNSALRQIKKHITNICDGKAIHEGEDISGPSLPHVAELIGCPDVLSKLLNISDSSELSSIESGDEELQRRLMRAVFLSAYIMNNVYFVCLLTTDENYAFDIFDSLNTTGTPLTAYETFVPFVMRNEGIDEYLKSDSKKYIDAINGYLKTTNKKRRGDVIKERSDKTKELLITFALAEDGTTLSNHLPSQRRYLINEYNRQTNKNEKELFVRHLKYTSDTWGLIWQNHNFNVDENLLPQDIKESIKEARFCLGFLKKAGHTISLPLITRFYASVENSKPGDEHIQNQKIKELCGAIKAIAAFFTIWRSCRAQTGGIDAHYRTIMKDGVGENMKFNKKEGDSPNLEKLQKSFCYLLKEYKRNKKQVKSVGDWVTHSRDIPIYESEKEVAKFILMTAYHNTSPDPDNPGLITEVFDGVRESLIDLGKWNSDDYKSLEHIIPQSHDGDSMQDVADFIHSIGNLTVLPIPDNSIIGKRSWKDKKAIYRFLSAETPEEVKRFKNELPEDLSLESIETLRKTRYLPMTRAVSDMDDFCSKLDIQKRGENILCNSWSVLYKWLNFPSSK